MKVEGNGNVTPRSNCKLTKQEYQNKQEKLEKSLIHKPDNVDDMKKNAQIIKEQIKLAKEFGDTELVKNLERDLSLLEHDIAKSSSIF